EAAGLHLRGVLEQAFEIDLVVHRRLGWTDISKEGRVHARSLAGCLVAGLVSAVAEVRPGLQCTADVVSAIGARRLGETDIEITVADGDLRLRPGTVLRGAIGPAVVDVPARRVELVEVVEEAGAVGSECRRCGAAEGERDGERPPSLTSDHW